MQMYLADCIFPDIDGQLAAYKSFCELWDSGEMAKADNFPGFEMLFRVHAPGAGRVTCLFKAESDAQIFEHFAPWRAQYGIEMDFTPLHRLPRRSGPSQKTVRQNGLSALAVQPDRITATTTSACRLHPRSTASTRVGAFISAG